MLLKQATHLWMFCRLNHFHRLLQQRSFRKTQLSGSLHNLFDTLRYTLGGCSYCAFTSSTRWSARFGSLAMICASLVQKCSYGAGKNTLVDSTSQTGQQPFLHGVRLVRYFQPEMSSRSTRDWQFQVGHILSILL